MFAVIILGIGFIMVAAIFPVAIQQAKSTTEETNAASIALAASDFTSRLALSKFSFYPTDPQYRAQGSPLLASDLLLAVGRSGTNIVPPLPPQATAVQNVTPMLTIARGQSRMIRGTVAALGDRRIMEELGGTHEYPLRSTTWNAVRGNLILAADPRYAWIVLYRRDRTYRNTDPLNDREIDKPEVIKDDSPLAQVFLFAVQARNTATFTQADITDWSRPYQPYDRVANLQPRPVAVKITSDGDGNVVDQVIQIGQWVPPGLSPADTQDYPNAAVEGAYIIIADDRPDLAADDVNRGRFNGRIYRIGVQRTDLGPNFWELAPGSEFVPEPDPDGTGPLTAINGFDAVNAFIIGRGYTNPADPRQGHSGPSMAISAYTTFVRVN
ncbi:hypothetical protein [Fontivita pretiosa]|uniref:hypothetical protein n=1 Tax=Fontivita pretiosa TaxID=2989684 RepID=UPI003D16D3ED